MEENKNNENKEKENNIPSEDELPVRKKSKEKDKENVTISPEDLDQILNQLKERFNVDDDNIKIVKIERKKSPVKESIISIILSYVFDLVLMASLVGFLKVFEPNILSILLLSVMFSTLENVFKFFMMKYFAKLMFLSLGTILLPTTIISFVVASLITPNLVLDNSQLLIPFFVLFLLVRGLLKMYLMRRNFQFNRFRGIKK